MADSYRVSIATAVLLTDSVGDTVIKVVSGAGEALEILGRTSTRPSMGASGIEPRDCADGRVAAGSASAEMYRLLRPGEGGAAFENRFIMPVAPSPGRRELIR